MGRNSKIEGTHHPFHSGWGCVKVSTACDHGTAETWAKRVGADVWGAKAPRRFFTNKHWTKTGRWPNRDPIGERGGVNLYLFVGTICCFRVLGENEF